MRLMLLALLAVGCGSAGTAPPHADATPDAPTDVTDLDVTAPSDIVSDTLTDDATDAAYAEDALADAGVDGGPADVGAELVATDVPAEDAVDVAEDTAVDVPVDVPVDVAMDVGTDAPSDVPADVPADARSGLVGVVAVAAGANHTCALMGDSTVRCWGANADGQLGDGTTTRRPFATAVPELSNVCLLYTSDAADE